jgi:hypothetical protein
MRLNFDLNSLTRLKDLGRFRGLISGLFNLVLTGNIKQLNQNTTYLDEKGQTNSFSNHYAQHILPKVKEFEAKRIETLITLKSRVTYSVIIALAALLFTALLVSKSFIAENHFSTLKIIGGILFLGLIAWIYFPYLRYKQNIKLDIFPKIFSFLGSDFNYRPDSALTVRSLQPFNIIPKYDRETTEDYVKGIYKDVSIELFEANLTCIEYRRSTNTRNRRNDERHIPIFRGLFIQLDMNKNFKGQTIVTKDAGSIGNFFGDMFKSMQNVKLEDPQFEKFFQVYSTDQIEARYLLTTSFMDRLIKLRALFQNEGLQASFHQSKLLLMIDSSKNLFEPESIFEPATFIEDCRTILNQMQLIFQIIDTLKLNEQTRL